MSHHVHTLLREHHPLYGNLTLLLTPARLNVALSGIEAVHGAQVSTERHSDIACLIKHSRVGKQTKLESCKWLGS